MSNTAARQGFVGRLDRLSHLAGEIAEHLGGDVHAPPPEGLRSALDLLSRRIHQIGRLAGFAGTPPPGRHFVNSLGMTMVELPAGSYSRGTSQAERDRLAAEAQAMLDQVRSKDPQARLPWIDLWLKFLDNEGPQHRVRFQRPFHMAAHEVTVGQFRRFVLETGYLTEVERFEETGVRSFGLDLRTGLVEPRSYYNWRFWLREDKDHPSGFVQTDEHPVVCVSWNDAAEFCRWMSGREGRSYRLPTEAEWEYACRAGSTARYSFGDDPLELRRYGNVADESLRSVWKIKLPTGETLDAPPYALAFDDGVPFTAEVGRFEPNAWKLYDLHGNGGEWCLDWYAPYGDQVAAGEELVDPVHDPEAPPPVDFSDVIPGAPPKPLRVIRGGVWLDPPFGFRCADRETHRRHPVDSAADIGFRVVCSDTAPRSRAAYRPAGKRRDVGSNRTQAPGKRPPRPPGAGDSSAGG